MPPRSARTASSIWKRLVPSRPTVPGGQDPSFRDRWKDVVRRVERLHRRIPDPTVLERLLPLRAALLPGRSASVAAVERAHRFDAVAQSSAAASVEAFAGQTRRIELLGLTWWVPLTRPGDEAYTTRYLAKQDFPFRAITQTREVAIGGIMLDIGANVGRMSIPRVVLGDVQMAYCAEPEPLNFACLSANVRDNHLSGLVMPERVAIGATDGVARMMRTRNSGGHRVLADRDQAVPDSIDVPCVTLDSWVARLGIASAEVAFVKVDAQGSELDILRGAGRLLAHRHVAWQMEVDAALLAQRGASPEALYAVLRQHFTHFVDLRRDAPGARVRAVDEIAAALTYVTSTRGDRTDVLLFNAVDDPA